MSCSCGWLARAVVKQGIGDLKGRPGEKPWFPNLASRASTHSCSVKDRTSGNEALGSKVDLGTGCIVEVDSCRFLILTIQEMLTARLGVSQGESPRGVGGGRPSPVTVAHETQPGPVRWRAKTASAGEEEVEVLVVANVGTRQENGKGAGAKMRWPRQVGSRPSVRGTERNLVAVAESNTARASLFKPVKRQRSKLEVPKARDGRAGLNFPSPCLSTQHRQADSQCLLCESGMSSSP